MPMKDKEDFYTGREAAKRRDEVVRRMAMTPPDHKPTLPRPGKKKPTGAGRAKGRAR